MTRVINSMLWEPAMDPAWQEWHEVTKGDYHYLSVNTMTRPIIVWENEALYGKIDDYQGENA